MGFRDAVASAGPYANTLHSAPDGRLDAVPDTQPTVSKH